ncbi:cytochrome c oxidase subunit 3 [Oceanibacterium hippocampi]|uniref:Cytochrome c oxidase subunit 3 n=1 Tax=Oceanibacterium hippocampi TaxID=745714 RepID=A0A1Y5S618_9PROT|nr:cytochrome c oxidase subunit 3 [Oceanibacterium hippocampi]SLN33282.1 Cytochrome c oxidase subunit 3 [Oceanibacterium hippocampi]
MADAHEVNHDYHLVDPSPWPVVGSITAFMTAIGLVMYMHDMGSWLLIVGTIGILYTMFVWWRDVVREGEFQGFHTPVVQLGLRYGMVLFIASEVMFFAAWFWAYFNASLFPTEAMGGVWPPEGIETFDPWHLPFLNTLILLTSGTTVTWAHHALQHGDRKGLVNGLILTVILGALFTCVQAYEYSHAAFGFTDGIYASTFYMATGFHGFHVLVGTIFLLVCLVRAMKGQFKPDHHFGFEAAAWYWHFVDVVWLFLFCCIYWWGAGTVAHG